MKLEFGNVAAIVEAVWRTAYKAGIGADLAGGIKKAGGEVWGARAKHERRS